MPKSFRVRSIGFFFSFLTALFACFAMAQDGVSTAGAARARYLGNLGIIPTSREVAVEDFVNYHRHEIGRPKAGEAVALDLRWGSSKASASREAILQIGLSTSLVHDRQQLRPLNLSLVIDKSGSMAEANKLIRVQAALQTLVKQLRPTDTSLSSRSILRPRSFFPPLRLAIAKPPKQLFSVYSQEARPTSTPVLCSGIRKHLRTSARNPLIALFC